MKYDGRIESERMGVTEMISDYINPPIPMISLLGGFWEYSQASASSKNNLNGTVILAGFD